jgi:DNA-binding NarL/FixJ family response regulator
MAGDALLERQEAGNGPEQVTILVADDNERFRSGMVRALQRCPGVLVVADADNGARALENARELHPDVLLADARMPLLDGLGLARAVTADAHLQGTRVVLLSARNDRRLHEDAAAAGAVGCLDKSDSRRAICDAVLAFAGWSAPA